jgi:hypothetical protein
MDVGTGNAVDPGDAFFAECFGDCLAGVHCRTW